MRDLEPHTALVAIVPSRRDRELVRTQGWYRIPVRSAPGMVKEGEITHIAFYFPGIFGEEKYSVRWYAPVEGITVRKRYDWANAVFKDDTPMRAADTEATAYAIPDDFIKEDLAEVVKPYFPFIFEMELFGVCTDPDQWPAQRTWKMFDA